MKINNPLRISGPQLPGVSFKRAALLALGLSVFCGELQAAPQSDKPWREGRILVKPLSGLQQGEFDQIVGRHGGKAIGRLRNMDVHVIQVPAQAEDAVAKALARNPHVSFAEKDMLVEATEITPDDPLFSDAWHLPVMRAPLAWEMATADGITIAILDTGVDSSHPDLSSQMVAGWNSVSSNSDSSDIMGHGTKVAGTAAATTNNLLGVSAIGWNANIMPIRVTNASEGWASYSDIANGLTWAADHGADVANISYNVSSSSTVTSAAQYMRNRGGVVVVAAGNDGVDTGLSDNPSLITVSATGADGDRASWSNYGNFIDVAAPGKAIRTTTLGGGYGSVSGTSFASPATAGLVALIMGANPDLSPDEIESILESTAHDPVEGLDWHTYYGHGRIDAADAVYAALLSESSPGDYESPQVAIISPSSGSSLSGMIVVDVSATDNVGVTEVSLFAGNEFIGADSSAPYRFSWDSTNYNDGEITFTASALDSAGNKGDSRGVDATVNNTSDVVDVAPPTLQISNPSDGSSVKRTVTVIVDAWDDVNIATINLYVNGQLKSSTSSASLSYGWNTRKEADGVHTIVAEALDTSGNTSSKSIQVQIGSSSDSTGDTGKPNRGKGKK